MFKNSVGRIFQEVKTNLNTFKTTTDAGKQERGSVPNPWNRKRKKNEAIAIFSRAEFTRE